MADIYFCIWNGVSAGHLECRVDNTINSNILTLLPSDDQSCKGRPLDRSRYELLMTSVLAAERVGCASSSGKKCCSCSKRSGGFDRRKGSDGASDCHVGMIIARARNKRRVD